MAYDLTGRAIFPISDLISLAEFPLADYLLTDTINSIFDGLYYTEADSYQDGPNRILDIQLVFEHELAINLPGSDYITLVLVSAGPGWSTFRTRIVIGPDFSMSLIEVSLGLRIHESVLRKVDPSGPAEVYTTADIHINPDGVSVDNFTGVSLDEAYLCGTEIRVSADHILPVFGEQSFAPQTVADQPDFRGFLLEEATITVPEEYISTDGGGALQLSLSEAAIGSTGFTGKLTARSEDFDNLIKGECLGFPFAFREFRMEIIQNSVIQLSLGVDLRVKSLEDNAYADADPNLQKWVSVDLSFSQGGAFSGALAAAQPPGASSSPDVLIEFEFEEVVRFGINGLRVTRSTENKWALYFSGGLELLLDTGNAQSEWPKIEFDEIGVRSDGELLLPDGAGIAFASPLIVEWHFARLSVTKFRLGKAKDNPDKLELGLSAGVTLLEGLPAGASVEGLIVRWEPGSGNDPEVSFSGIGIQFGVPGCFNAEVEVSYIEEGGAIEFRGRGALELTALDMGLEIGIIVGLQSEHPPDYPEPFVYLYLFADAKLLPSGIPIGQTGLSIYGFQGLIAYNMALVLNTSLPEDERYYELFTRPPKIGITHIDKWIRRKDQNALGVGISLGTADTGFSVNVKGLLVVVFPDLVLLLQAKANFIKIKPDLTADQEGTLDALMVYDAGQSTISIDILAHWGMPVLVSIDAQARAFFDFDDPMAWYLEIGRDQDGRRVTAKAIGWNGNWLFTAGAWFRIDMDGVLLGAQIELGLRKSKAGFWVEVSGWARGEACISWAPVQFEGSLAMSGKIGAGYKGISILITLSGNARVRAPKPMDVRLTVEACIKALLWEVCKSFTFEWERPQTPQIEAPIGKWAATPRHWTPRRLTAAGSDEEELDTGIIDLVRGQPAPTIHPHCIVSLDFHDPVVDATEAFNDAVDLASEGWIAIGRHSGWASRRILESVQLIRDPDNDAEQRELWGVWAAETPKLNTKLRLQTSDRFGDDGSLSGAYVENIEIDDCKTLEDAIHCVPLDDVDPGYGWLEDGSLYFWQPGADSGEGESNGDENGVALGKDGSLSIELANPRDRVRIVTHPQKPDETSVQQAGLCKRRCLLLVLGLLGAAAAIILMFLGWLLPPIRPIVALLTPLLVLLMTVVLIVLLFCICISSRRLQGEEVDDHNGGTDEGASSEDADDDHSDDSNDDSSESEHTPIDVPSNGVVMVTGDNTGDDVITHICFQAGFESPAWLVGIRPGGRKTGYEQWTLPLSAQLFPVDPTEWELRVAYRVELKGPANHFSTPIRETVSTRFKVTGPPNYINALDNYIGRVYPSDGSRPVYTGYDLIVVFREAYVPAMYEDVNERLVLRLFDGQGHPVRDSEDNPILIPVSKAEPEPVSPIHHYWERLRQINVERECVEDDYRTPETTAVVASADNLGFTLTRNSQYVAQLVSDQRPNIPLHEWGFTTSAFQTFQDLVTRSRYVATPVTLPGALDWRDFEAAIRSTGFPTVNFVERFTITPLIAIGSNQCIAFLFESPEPLDVTSRLTVRIGGVSCEALANVDQTRAIFRREDGLGWPIEETNVELTWARDAGEEVPKLTVAGNADDEVVAFIVNLGGNL